jgi:metal-dependent amidase/aminoacylase/carboxypeptidase family protein
VGFLRAGEADNVVPETAELKGIVRTEDPGDRALLERRLGEAARGLAQAHGVELEWYWSPGYPAARNDAAWAERAEKAVTELFGPEALLRLERPVATAEDVAFYLERVPGAFIFLGTNNPGKGITEPHHSPRFDVDEDQLWKGVALGTELISTSSSARSRSPSPVFPPAPDRSGA